MKIKIGKPVDEVPGVYKAKESKYDKIFSAVQKLDDSKILPVSFDNLNDTHAALFILKRRGLTVNRRGQTLYLSKKVKSK